MTQEEATRIVEAFIAAAILVSCIPWSLPSGEPQTHETKTRDAATE